MKAVVFEEHGGTEVLQYRDVDIPEISSDEVLLRVRAAGFNYNDIWARQGVPGIEFILPHISGSDAAGVVEAVGSGVKNVKIGDEIIVSASFSCGICHFCNRGEHMFCPEFKIWGFQTGPLDGAQGEYAKVPAANVIPKPENITWEEAASLPIVLVTAWRMLVTKAKLRPGDLVLIWGAAGGLGSIAIQICKLFSARAIAVCSDDTKAEHARQLGAEYVINRSRQRVLREVSKISKRRGVDIVFEHVGAATWETSIHALKWGGTIVICGATTGYNATTDLRFLWNKQQNYLGSHIGTTSELLDAMRFVQSGHIKAVVMDVLPLKDVALAHDILEKNEIMGKLVLIP